MRSGGWRPGLAELRCGREHLAPPWRTPSVAEHRATSETLLQACPEAADAWLTSRDMEILHSRGGCERVMRNFRVACVAWCCAVSVALCVLFCKRMFSTIWTGVERVSSYKLSEVRVLIMKKTSRRTYYSPAVDLVNMPLGCYAVADATFAGQCYFFFRV